MQADTFGMSTAAIETAAEAAAAAQRVPARGRPDHGGADDRGRRPTPRCRPVQQAIEQIERPQRDWTVLKEWAQDSLKGLFSDLREGKSLVDSLANALTSSRDKILDMMLDSMFNPKSQGGFNIFQLLFGGGNQIRLPSLPSTVPNQGIATSCRRSVTSRRGDCLSGESIRPSPDRLCRRSRPSAARGGTNSVSSAIGGTFTKVTDGLRNTVEQYLRAGAEARGLDPDIIARGIKQDSGFNPFAHGRQWQAPMALCSSTPEAASADVARQRGISLAP